jgi:signal transduction histidine kinase
MQSLSYAPGSEKAKRLKPRFIKSKKGQRRNVTDRIKKLGKGEALNLKHAHRTLEAILSKVPVGIVILSMDREVLWLNKAAMTMAEINSEDEIIGQTCHKHLCPAEYGKCPVIDFGQELDHSERTLLTSSGQVIPILKSALKTTLDGLPVLIEAFADISEQKRFEKERNMMEVRLRQSQKLESIGQLASGIAHEINTPIQFISDNLSFLEQSFADIQEALGFLKKLCAAVDDVPDETEVIKTIPEIKNKLESMDLDFILNEVKDAVSQSLEGAGRIAKIVQAMKEFAHGSGRTSSSLCDLNRIIENTVTISKNEWKHYAELELELSPGPLNVMGACDEIGQVFLNLIVNAAHAIEDSGASASFKGTIKAISHLDGAFASVSISDTGKGIPEDIKDKIFDPFFTTKEVGRGSGQGLSIAHDIIVRKHKGELSFYPGQNGGTVFSVKLPTKEEYNK